MALPISSQIRKSGDICRLCLKQNERMVPIFDVIKSEKNYFCFAERITSIAHVEINSSDGLPSTICEACKNLVEQFYEFQLQVEISDKALKSYLKAQLDSQNVDNSLNNMHTDIRDMVYALITPNDEVVEIWNVSNISQDSEQLNKIIKIPCINNQENIPDMTTINNEISCQLCSISFTSLSDLKNHVVEHCLVTEKQVNEVEQIHNSILIDDNTLNEEKTNTSSHQHTKQKIITTDEFNNGNNLIEKGDGIIRISGPKLRCKYCDQLFSKITFIMHKEKCSFRVKELVCDQCGKRFKKRSELRYHKGTHLTTPLTCEYCNKQFRNLQSFSIHVKRHIHGTRYHCETCGKSYYTNSELTRHVQMHLDKRKHPCHLCDMSFMSQPELNRHLQYHNGVKRFECNVCAKSYYESGHLKVHQRIHTGERPFVCHLCNKGFVTRSKLVRHMKIHEK